MRPLKCLGFLPLLLLYATQTCNGQPEQEQAGSGKNQPAQVVLVLLSEPAGFKALEMDGVPFASLAIPADVAGVWPTEPGKRTLVVKAPAAPDKEVQLDLVAGQTTLLFLGLKKGEMPNTAVITAKLLTPRLPQPKAGSKKMLAMLAPDSPAVSAKLMRGTDSKFADIQLSPGKLELIGEGATVLKIGQQVVISGDPASSGNYVFIVVPEPAGGFRTVAFSEIVPEPEQ